MYCVGYESYGLHPVQICKAILRYVSPQHSTFLQPANLVYPSAYSYKRRPVQISAILLALINLLIPNIISSFIVSDACEINEHLNDIFFRVCAALINFKFFEAVIMFVYVAIFDGLRYAISIRFYFKHCCLYYYIIFLCQGHMIGFVF